MHYTPEEEDRIRAEIDAARAERSSASAPSETACQPRSLALANCCLWVPAGLLEQLCRAWESGAKDRREAAARHSKDDLGHSITDALYDQAQTLDDCAMELRLLAGDASARQPTDNV